MTIRPQYHFRPGPDGLMAWDVRRLICLAEPLPVFELQLTALAEVDEDWWFFHGPKPTVRSIAEHAQLAERAELHFPILLCAEGRLMDGMHRVLKALTRGQASLPARRFAVTPEPDYRNADPDALPYEP
jgi:hypothetical protein